MSQAVALHHSMPLIDSNPTTARPCPVCEAPIPAGATYCSMLCQVYSVLQAQKADAESAPPRDERMAQFWKGRASGLGVALAALRAAIEARSGRGVGHA